MWIKLDVYADEFGGGDMCVCGSRVEGRETFFLK